MSKIAKVLAWRHESTADQTQHSPRDKNISKEIDLFRLMISGKIKQNQGNMNRSLDLKQIWGVPNLKITS